QLWVSQPGLRSVERPARTSPRSGRHRIAPEKFLTLGELAISIDVVDSGRAGRGIAGYVANLKRPWCLPPTSRRHPAVRSQRIRSRHVIVRHIRGVTGWAGCRVSCRSERRFLVGPVSAFALAFIVRPVPGRALLLGGKLGFELLDPCLEYGDGLGHRAVTERWPGGQWFVWQLIEIDSDQCFAVV